MQLMIALRHEDAEKLNTTNVLSYPLEDFIATNEVLFQMAIKNLLATNGELDLTHYKFTVSSLGIKLEPKE